MKLAVAILLAALILSGGARADIYGFIDENGAAHLSNTPLDHRYYLFKKESRPALLPGSDDAMAGVPVPAPRRTTRVNPADRKHYTPLISAVAKEIQLDPALLHAVIAVESGYNPKARSPKGAIGLMQLMPDTARRYEVADIWDPRDNLRGGARYLRDLLAAFNNNLSLALAAYNAGEGAVAQYGNKIPPFAETLNYVPRVLQQYHLLNGTVVEGVTRDR
ncbi:MAG TPA: lytic transglycosylase domain-containing protein [Burkholderiales bacterium]|nr:lytic transglycosylase domain-containing protein [Burkholderiales bacterium]